MQLVSKLIVRNYIKIKIQIHLILYNIQSILAILKLFRKKCELLKHPDLHFLMKKKILGEFYKELTELFQNKKNYNNQY